MNVVAFTVNMGSHALTSFQMKAACIVDNIFPQSKTKRTIHLLRSWETTAIVQSCNTVKTKVGQA